MRLLKKRKATVTKRENAMIVRFANTMQRYQATISSYLNLKTQYWNRSSKIIALALFCLLFGGCFAWLLIKAINQFNK